MKRREDEEDKRAVEVGASPKFRVRMLSRLSEYFQDRAKLKEVLGGSGAATSDMSKISEKKRFMNFLRFLGELFMAGFIPKKIISFCIQSMLAEFIVGSFTDES